MATNKNAQMRYQILDKCFRNSGRRYFIQDLIDECNKVLKEVDSESKGISRRQIFDDIAFMESAEGWSIDLLREKQGRRVYYRYADVSFSINNMPLDETEISRLLASLQTISQFKGMPQFEWVYGLLPKLTKGSLSPYPDTIMEFDSNQDLTGIEYIGIIYNAILYKKVLQIDYLQSFETKIRLTIHPYYLKQYNNRWFLFGYNLDYDKYDWNLPLDRILDISETNDSYNSNTKIDWNEYFDDIIGVTKPERSKPEKIILHFYGKTGHYISSKPIHGYQKHRWIDSGTLEVNLNLIVNYELERFILSYADSVKVIQPFSLAEKIKERIKRAYEGIL
jgi:hypothetical protein